MARAVAPVVGVALLLVITVVAATAIGTAVTDVEPSELADDVAVAVTADASDNRITLRHAGGDALNVSEVSVTISVEGQDLAHQPPIPYFAAEGFVGAPTGPFNEAADPRWSAGERASLELASTNEPTIEPGDRVAVTLSTDETELARASARAR